MENSTDITPSNISSADTDEVENAAKGEQRDNWSGKLEFLMSCIALSVGLGNIWRFPFTAYENGGGAFLIPYIIVLFLIGKPIYYMEALIGQFSSKSSIKIWSVCPSFLGVGIGEAYAVLAVMSYYAALIALSFYYFIASFQAVLPWSYCREDWGPSCVNSTIQEKMVPTDEKLQSSSELYFIKTVLREVDDLAEGVGTPSWRLVLTLLATWIVAFGVIIKGVKSLGKASYFLAIFPYVILITLLVRAVTLEGASDGIIYFLRPNWGELLNLRVWKEAVVQCFFSLTVAFGPIVTFSSYNKFNHNVHRDAMIVTTLDTFTSLTAGITIFGILGNLAFNLGIDSIDEVVRSGTGLAFISYPDACAKFTVIPQLFAVLFFLMLSILGIGSIVALLSTVVTILIDQFHFKSFWKVSSCISVLGFAVGIVYTTPGGQWVLNLVDYFAGTFVVFCLAIFEITGVQWIYGMQNFCDDVEFMTNKKVSIYWRLCWGFITPVLLLIIFIYTMVQMDPISYGGIRYPVSADIAGWVILAIGFAQFPLWGIWYLSTHQGESFKKTIKIATSATSEWGPSDPETRAKWILFKSQLKDEREKERESKNWNVFKQKFYYMFGFSK